MNDKVQEISLHNRYSFKGSNAVDLSADGDHSPTYGGGGGGGGGDNMNERVKKLEDQVSSLLVDMAVIKSNYATKEDTSKLNGTIEGVRTELHQSIASQTKWLVGSMFIALGAGLTIAKLIF